MRRKIPYDYYTAGITKMIVGMNLLDDGLETLHRDDIIDEASYTYVRDRMQKIWKLIDSFRLNKED